MKKNILSLTAIILLATGMVACKGKKKDAEANTTTEQSTGGNDTKATDLPNEPKTYQLGGIPDSVLLGKEKEAFVKFLGGEAIELQDREGKSTGLNIKFKLRATNKSTLDKKKFFNISPSDARLELDNGTTVTAKNGDQLNPDPESSLDGSWEFEIPAGTKPTKLNLYNDGTRVGIAISLQ